jgi:hypothetical protein
VNLTVPARKYDALYQQARAARMSFNDFLRARLFRVHRPDPDR